MEYNISNKAIVKPYRDLLLNTVFMTMSMSIFSSGWELTETNYKFKYWFEKVGGFSRN